MPRPFSKYSSDDLFEAAKVARGRGDSGSIAAILQEFVEHRNSRRSQSHRRTIEGWLNNWQNAQHTEQQPGPTRQSSRSSRQASPANTADERGSRHPPITPTAEQQRALECFQSGLSLKMNAFAGTGKTSTLSFIARSTRKTGIYLAFNKSIVRDSIGAFPSNVACSTVHGLAARAIAPHYNSRTKMFGKINAKQLVEYFQLQDWNVYQHYTLSAISQAQGILDGVNRFCLSANTQVVGSHIRVPRSISHAPPEIKEPVVQYLTDAAQLFWEHMIHRDTAIPLGHNGYLKRWALSEPQLSADFIMLDEAQDTSEVVLDVLKRQTAQIVIVGDKHQQIYEWLGAINAMSKFSTSFTTTLTESFRFGPEIAKIASRILKMLDEKNSLVGNSAKSSAVCKIEEPRAVLSRTNAGSLQAIIEILERGKSPCLVGGIDELKKLLLGVVKLKGGEPCDVPEFYGFQNWQEVMTYVKQEDGDELQMFVNLVEMHGENKLLWCVNRCVEEEHCDIVVSTAHKSKGRQWETVKLSDDFASGLTPKSGPIDGSTNKTTPNSMAIDPAELRLFYVAVTRASEKLDIPMKLTEVLGWK